jgi:hypothetical protein
MAHREHQRVEHAERLELEAVLLARRVGVRALEIVKDETGEPKYGFGA